MVISEISDYSHRGRIFGATDKLGDLEQSLKHQTTKISWGKPAMFVQAKLDGRCPVCSVKEQRGRFETGFDNDVGCSWAYCHQCGWSY